MNTTFHWRANVTNLLSREFMVEIARHLEPKHGVLTFNTTQSLDAFRTASDVFPAVYRYAGFAYAGFDDFRVDAEVSRTRLSQVQVHGKPIFEAEDFQASGSGAKLAGARLEPAQDLLKRHAAPAGVITDANMLTEFRHGKRTGIALLDRLLPPREDVLIRDR